MNYKDLKEKVNAVVIDDLNNALWPALEKDLMEQVGVGLHIAEKRQLKVQLFCPSLEAEHDVFVDFDSLIERLIDTYMPDCPHVLSDTIIQLEKAVKQLRENLD